MCCVKRKIRYGLRAGQCASRLYVPSDNILIVGWRFAAKCEGDHLAVSHSLKLLTV